MGTFCQFQGNVVDCSIVPNIQDDRITHGSTINVTQYICKPSYFFIVNSKYTGEFGGRAVDIPAKAAGEPGIEPNMRTPLAFFEPTASAISGRTSVP
jgi:hypothetical protein